MPYLFATDEEQQEMLEAIGVRGIDDLFEMIPEDARLNRELDLPEALTEMELDHHLRSIIAPDRISAERVCFQGGGAYDHFIPATVDEICSRGEFYTAYTPYQAEASQGTLQAFFEFQSMMTELTGLEVANASLYDGASAVAEAIIMAMRATRRSGKVIIAGTLHPEYSLTAKTYLNRLGCEVVETGQIDGVADWQQAAKLIDKQTAAVVVQHPNFYGHLEDVNSVVELAHQAGALAIEVFDPISTGVLKRPGDYGFDIAVAEGQCLGTPLQFGGPYLAILAAKKKLVRSIPGRLIGQTTDRSGKTAYVLNLQTREQHIRRDKATSNICTNQGLLALRTLIHLAQLGPQGLKEAGELCCRKSHYAADRLTAAGIGTVAFPHPFFKEFVFTPHAPVEEIIGKAKQAGFNIGPAMNRFELGEDYINNSLLIAVTEKRTREEIDALVEALSAK